MWKSSVTFSVLLSGQISYFIHLSFLENLFQLRPAVFWGHTLYHLYIRSWDMRLNTLSPSTSPLHDLSTAISIRLKLIIKFFYIFDSSPVFFLFCLLLLHTVWPECSFLHNWDLVLSQWILFLLSISISPPPLSSLSGSPLAHCRRWGHHHCTLPARSPIISKTAPG